LTFSERSFSGLGLLTAAGVATQEIPNIHIEFIDENMEAIRPEERPGEGYDLLAMGGTIYQMNRMFSLIHMAQRENFPVVVGGAAVMTFPDIFKRKRVTVIMGESEMLFPDFIKDFQNGRPKTIYRSTPGPGFNLSESPIPDYPMLSKYDYSFIGVQTTRGCPSRCGFCQVSRWLGYKYRHKDPDQIIQEIKIVKSIWPDAFFFFYDDNLFADHDFAAALFEKMASEQIDLGRWGANADASIYREDDLLDLALTRGRLDYLGIGFESLSRESLHTIGNSRKADLRKAYGSIVEKLKKKGIGVFGYFMFGFENSKPRDLSSIVDFILTHEINGQISQLVPMPGTILYNQLVSEYEKKFGKIVKGPLGRWHLIRKYLLDKTGMSQTEVTRLLAEAYSKIYDDAVRAGGDLLPAPYI
jgi:radical SAM superfamily enzyme YgiQ (UPF0313 family)